jgi:hypothetical protein
MLWADKTAAHHTAADRGLATGHADADLLHLFELVLPYLK